MFKPGDVIRADAIDGEAIYRSIIGMVLGCSNQMSEAEEHPDGKHLFILTSDNRMYFWRFTDFKRLKYYHFTKVL